MQHSRAVQLFILVSAVLAVPAMTATLTTGKLALHAAINAHHTLFFDLFFSLATHLADGILPALLALLLLFVRDMRSFLMMGFGTGLSALAVQLLKHQVFPHMHRPGKFREGLGDMLWVEGVELNSHFSFPSGHATAAFSMCLALAVILGRPRWGIAMALVAAILSFSRVYLSQHFTQDILAGAALGTLVTFLVYLWLYRSVFAKRAWLDRRPFQLPK